MGHHAKLNLNCEKSVETNQSAIFFIIEEDFFLMQFRFTKEEEKMIFLNLFL